VVAGRGGGGNPIVLQISRVFVIVAVETEQFPIAAVRWIVVVVVVPVVDRQFMEILPGEFPCAAATDPGIHLQRLFSVTLLTLFPVPSRFGDDPVESVVSYWRFV